MRVASPSTASEFCEAWIPEFIKSVEMFTGAAIALEAPAAASGGVPEDYLWQGQVFERNGPGVAWIGTPLSTVDKIADGLADDGSGRATIYREILRQSFEGAAHILSGGETPRMVCGAAIEDRAQPSGFSQSATLTAVLADGERVVLSLLFDKGFEALLAAPAEEEAATSDAGEQDDRLDRLVDLELPMTVVIGRCKVNIRSAIKLAAGSLIELDRRGNEPVEVVIHNAVVARGEVVSIDGSYGVRITEVMSRKDRASLQSQAAQSRATASRPSIH